MRSLVVINTSAEPLVPTPPKGDMYAIVGIKATPFHPALMLFASKQDAVTVAKEYGPPWVPFAFACGYLLTTGWEFRDANGKVATFCPVPHKLLEALQSVVKALHKPTYAPKDYPRYIHATLFTLPEIQALPKSYFEAVCFCTVMRMGYPDPCGNPMDWLTIPAWTLRLKRRQLTDSTKPLIIVG